ncbi:MAG: methyltransferase domain-containing protein, partial [Pseudomonadota bacterium]
MTALARHSGRPPTGPAGDRTAEEQAALHAFRLARARAWFEAAAAAAPDRHCPICGYAGPFSPVRHKIGIWCPGCDSRPRHRLMHLWLTRTAVLREGLRILHFAAEPFLRPMAEAAGCHYTTADIAPGFDRVLDIEAIALPDACQDLVIANHVLEHVDDARALVATLGDSVSFYKVGL